MNLEQTEIKVLDHGFVRLVSYMQPVTQKDDWTGDLEVVRNARVSYDADWRTGDSDNADEKLINYLYKNHHTSPFEAMVFTFSVKCPIYVARQWMRHRTQSYNEISARYAELPNEIYVPNADSIGVQSATNKQMRVMEDNPDIPGEAVARTIKEFNDKAYTLYKELVSLGVPREIARGLLPTAVYTRFFCTVNLHNLLKFIKLRDHPHAQPEIQVYAKAMLELVEPIVPLTVKAYQKF
jgi:thymidylate synthase (FAD)